MKQTYVTGSVPSRTVASHRTAMGRLLLMTLLLFAFIGGAKAQDYFYEDFEGGAMPEGWTTDGPGTWSVGTGDYSSSTGAGAGTYNAKITHSDKGDVTKLITPAIDLSTATAAQLSFMHIQRSWTGDIDKLSVYYRTSSEGEWVLLAEYTDAYDSWTTEGGDGEIILPNLSSTYQIAFEMTDAYGYGVGIDDVTISPVSNCRRPTDLAYTLTPGNGTVATLSWTENGTATAWEICLNDDETNLITATTNPWQLTGLTPETTYTAKVRAISGSDKSRWSLAVTFKPTNALNLTVNDGTATNGFVPIYGYYVDAITKSQFIIPAENLNSIAYGTINKLTFYAQDDKNWGVAEFEVYITETDATTLSALADYATMTKVVNARSLGISGGKMEVELDAPYEYNGGNLMIGFLQTVSGIFKSCVWYGVSASGASMGGYKNSISQQNFLPKITFDYTPGVQPTCLRPTGLAVSEISFNSAVLSWTPGSEDQHAWQICINGDEENLIDVTENPYTLTGLTPETAYTVKVRSNCGADDKSNWSANVSFTTLEQYAKPTGLAVSEVGAKTAVLSWTENGTASAWEICLNDDEENLITADSNPFTLTGLTPETAYTAKVRAYYGPDAKSNWSANVSFTTLEQYAKPTGLAVSEVGAKTAVLSWTENGEATAWEICLNDDEENLITADSNPFTLTDLTPETAYTAKVRAYYDTDAKSNWSAVISFTTDIAYPAPTGVAATEITRTSATISWTGVGDSYNLRYRVPRGFKYGFETAEPWAIDNFAPCTTYDGDQTECYSFSGVSYTNIPFTGSTIAFQSTGGNLSSHSGNAFGMMISAIPDDYPEGITHSDDWFILPEITISEGDVFSFWGREITTQYGPETINVGIYGETDGTFAATLAENVEVGTETWTEYSYDLSAYSGQTVRLAINYVSHDIFGFMFDDIFVGNPADDTWDETIANVTAPYTLENLNPSTEYEVEVQAVYTGEDAGESTWVGTSFTTKTGKEKPTDLAATEISATQATMSWTGYQDSYNVQYRTSEVIDDYYFTNFNTADDRVGWSWTDNSAIYGFSDPIYGYSGDENYFLPMGWNTTEEATIVSPELPDYESGTKVEFYYFGYQTANTFQVGFSTTNSDLDAFTWSEPIDAPLTEYTLFSEELPAGVKYVAFKATASAKSATVFIDNFRVYKFISPAGEWVSATTTEPTLTISGLTPETEYEWQVQGIYDDGTTEWVSGDSFTTKELFEIELVNDDTENDEYKKNSVFIADAAGKYCNVLLSDRTLFKDGNWNTICLPFDVDLKADGCPLAGATAKTLTDATMTPKDDYTLIELTFSEEVTTLEAGVPYIIMWDAEDGNIVNPEFTDVLIKDVPEETRTLSFAGGNVKFIGYYDAFTIGTDDIYYLADDNKLKNGGIGRIMKSCRAYFQFSDASTAREFVLNFGNGVTTGITTTDYTDSAAKADGWYTVDGKKLNVEPTRKGLYIQNGKKIVIK